MNPSVSNDSETESFPATTPVAEPVPSTEHDAHIDPISGETGAHPLGVGVGASAAGMAGAAIGAVLGPVGALIGAALGAVAGGLAGKEVATANDAPDAVVDRETLVTETEPVLTEPGVEGSIGAYAENQAQIGNPPLDRLSKDVGYKDAHESELKSVSALPRDVVPAPYEPAEPGDKEYATTHRGGEIPESAIAQPPVPGIGDSPYSLSDLPLAADEFNGTKSEGDTLVHDSDSEAAIRELAYQKYLARTQSGSPGDEASDWQEAENEVLRR